MVYVLSQQDEAETKSTYLRQKLLMILKVLGLLFLLKLQKAAFIWTNKALNRIFVGIPSPILL